MCTTIRRPVLLAAVGMLCPYCGEPMTLPDRAPSRDHIRPRKRGGTLDDRSNRAVVCCRCNSDKDHLSQLQFLNRLRRAQDPAPSALRHLFNISKRRPTRRRAFGRAGSHAEECSEGTAMVELTRREHVAKRLPSDFQCM